MASGSEVGTNGRTETPAAAAAANFACAWLPRQPYGELILLQQPPLRALQLSFITKHFYWHKLNSRAFDIFSHEASWYPKIDVFPSFFMQAALSCLFQA